MKNANQNQEIKDNNGDIDIKYDNNEIVNEGQNKTNNNQDGENELSMQTKSHSNSEGITIDYGTS